jgi:hypothetical protein
MTSSNSELPSLLPEQLSIQLAKKFNYADLDTQIRMVVQQRTSEIKNLMRRTAQDSVYIGQKLTEVKAQLGYGNFRKWLKAEFEWGIWTATKFMQVADKFRSVNFTHLEIAISALYLLASPSTPEEVRAEVLKRASQGENITYTKAKAIICNHKETAKPELEKPVIFDTAVETFEPNSTKSIERVGNGTEEVANALVELTRKAVETKTYLLSPLSEMAPSSASRDQHLVSIMEGSREQLDDTIQMPNNTENKAAIAQEIPEELITQVENGIKKLTPEQLTLVIINSANNGLSKRHLEAMLIAAKQVLEYKKIAGVA